MLAALNMIATNWRTDPAAETAIKLAEHSKDAEVRGKIARARASTPAQ
jgi:predicted nucleic acid-binding Zn ribbon protein